MNKEYQHNFLCTYQDIDDEKLSNICFQMQFLQAFNIETFDNKIINNLTESLYEELKNEATFKRLLINLKNNINNNNNDKINYHEIMSRDIIESLEDLDIFCFVFCYEYFYKFHKEYSAFKNKKQYNFNFLI